MIKANFNAYNNYITDSIYQWDINRDLTVSGLNLNIEYGCPEVHFSNRNTDRAIVRQATWASRILKVRIPNSLLQEPFTIYAHIGVYEGEAFKVIEKVEIPVIPKERPSDYQIQDTDEEIYSFKALENKLSNRATVSQVNTVDARVSNIIAHASETGDNAELIDIRMDAEGKVHTTAGDAIRTHFKKLIRGKSYLATLLPSSIGDYPSISTVDKTFTIGGDTLIISDRLTTGFVSLHENNGNNTVTWGSEITSSAICFYYDIANNKLVALSYNAPVIDYNYILLATLRIGHGTSEGKAWAVCSCPIYVDGKLSTEVNTIGGFVALLPPMHDDTAYPRFSTRDNTITMPYDTLIVDPRLPDNFVSLKDENGNNTVYFGDIISSAICIYYSIVNNTLIAKAYNERVNTSDYLLICTIRKTSEYGDVKPMVYASCPVWIDDRLSTDKPEEPIVYDHIVKSINHRGYNIEAPENTLSAFKLSKTKGFKYVECDVAFTSDNVGVILHDNTIDRTSNGTGAINSKTLAQVKALDFGSWFSSDYAGEKIPTFEEFIALCRNIGLYPYIELKAGSETEIKSLVDMVKRYGMIRNVTWISFDSNILGYVNKYDAKARIGFICNTLSETNVNTAVSLKTDTNEVFIDAGSSSVTAETAELCISNDLPLEVWTVNIESAVLSLDPYVTGVTSDSVNASRVLYEFGYW